MSNFILFLHKKLTLSEVNWFTLGHTLNSKVRIWTQIFWPLKLVISAITPNSCYNTRLLASLKPINLLLETHQNSKFEVHWIWNYCNTSVSLIWHKGWRGLLRWIQRSQWARVLHIQQSAYSWGPKYPRLQTNQNKAKTSYFYFFATSQISVETSSSTLRTHCSWAK